MSAGHIAINTWLDALGLHHYLPLFTTYGGVEDLLYASEAEIREVGVKNSAHRAKVVSSLRILREKYEKGKSTGIGVFSLQQPKSPTNTGNGPPTFSDFPSVIASPEKLEQDLQKELNADPSELKSRGWYHGNISRQRAEALVTAAGDFLVRDSISKPGDFVLTCFWRGSSLHFMVNAFVGDCAPGSLPSISYQFEEESFGSIQELIQFYLTRQKPVTLVSGAVLKNPVRRSMPLSYYDAKYGSLHSLDSGGHYTPSHSPKPSPFASPNSTPHSSPAMKRHGPKRTGSQPLLSVDDSEVNRSRSPSLERFGSLPVINIIPPGGPGYEGGQQETADTDITVCPTIVSHQRSGSAPVLMNDVNSNGILSSCPSMRMAPAMSESDLTRTPPPKPSRIPSIKYKKKPVVIVRNRQLYEDEDERDYTDMDQLSGPPSWADNERVAWDGQPGLQTPTVCKSHSFQGGRDSEVYDNNLNHVNKGYQTLPVKAKASRQNRPRRISDSRYAMVNKVDNKNVRVGTADPYDINHLKERQITMPGFNLGSRICLDSFSSSLFPTEDNRLLEPSVVIKAKSLLLSSNARAIAGHLTKVDLEVLRVAQEDDLGVGVTSGIELCTLPQGDQIRENIIERSECQRLFVMTSLVTCKAVTERARMLSQWIQTAGELRVAMGNLFAFTSVMEAVTAPQVQRLRDTWLVLRQKHTSSAFLFDTKLKALLKSINEGSGLLPVQNVTLPNLAPVVHLLQRDLDELDSLLSWEASDPNLGLDFLLSHLDIARIVASQTRMYRTAANAVLEEVKVDAELDEVCRTEFQMRLMWGSKGARASRAERLKKFDQLLMVLSERLEPPGDDGTAV